MSDTRERILAIERMLQSGGCISVPEIQRLLELAYGIECNRKTIYQDIYALHKFLPIVRKLQGNKTVYFIRK